MVEHIFSIKVDGGLTARCQSGEKRRENLSSLYFPSVAVQKRHSMNLEAVKQPSFYLVKGGIPPSLHALG
jgi:hypothetical protein